MKTPNNQKVISDSGNLQDYQDRSSANQAESIFSPVRFEQSDREKEAYRKIQQYSMAKRKTIKEIAEAIIASAAKKSR